MMYYYIHVKQKSKPQSPHNHNKEKMHNSKYYSKHRERREPDIEQAGSRKERATQDTSKGIDDSYTKACTVFHYLGCIMHYIDIDY